MRHIAVQLSCVRWRSNLIVLAIKHEAATTLGLSVRQVYRLIRKLREAQGELTALLSQGSDGGRGEKRLAASRENFAPPAD